MTLITLLSCKQEVRVLTPEQARKEAIQKRIDDGIWFIQNNDIHEFEYKGHTYMYDGVRDGVCVWHAGHCKCNPNR